VIKIDVIVLYLYIYVALLTVHIKQKRFQCERPREKRAVMGWPIYLEVGWSSWCLPWTMEGRD